ncbi:MAG: diphthine synthase [archaeon]
MLYLIGIGLNPKQITLEGIHAAQACETLYLETYTSKYGEGNHSQLETILHAPLIPRNREQVEDAMEDLVKEAAHRHVGILVYGNPLSATTHVSLLMECVAQKIPYRVIPGISIFNYRGMRGLDEYRFGRTTTFVFPQEGFEPLSTFDVIVENKKTGLHTHCLFDLHPHTQRFMTIPEAIAFIESASHAREVDMHAWIGVGIAGAGNANEQWHAGKLRELKKMEWTHYPQSLIVCGELTPYEREALQTLTGNRWV